MAAIMGRMAAYTGQEITWDMALNSQESLVPAKLDLEHAHPRAVVGHAGKDKKSRLHRVLPLY
jgi:hypothetical protein